MRATWLTWKMHRFEVVVVLIVLAVLGVSVWVTSSHIASLGLSDACWPRDEDGNYATRTCGELMERFWPMDDQAGYLRVALTIAPGILGIVLGVPIVARELEMRTTALAWSLTPSRPRWLLARFLPMLFVGIVGLGVVAWIGTQLFDALWAGRQVPDLTEIAAQGAPLLARGLMAVAVALLVGAIVGRTMPALLTAAVVLLVWSLMVVPVVQSNLTHQFAVWVRSQNDDWRDGVGPLVYDGWQGTFDASRPGIPGEPGVRVDSEEVNRLAEARVDRECGPYPEDDTVGSPEAAAWERCVEPIWQAVNDMDWERVVSRSHYGDYAVVDTLLSLLAGGAALLLTFPVVARRRPE